MSSLKGVRSSCYGGLERQCLVFAFVLIGNDSASSVWHLRTLWRLFFSVRVLWFWVERGMINTRSSFGSWIVIESQGLKMLVRREGELGGKGERQMVVGSNDVELKLSFNPDHADVSSLRSKWWIRTEVHRRQLGYRKAVSVKEC